MLGHRSSVKDVIRIVGFEHLLLLLLSRSVMKGLFNLQTQLFEKLNFFVVDIFVVKYLELFHPSLHLGTQPRVLLKQLGPPFRVLTFVNLLNQSVELCDSVPDLVRNAGQHLQLQL